MLNCSKSQAARSNNAEMTEGGVLYLEKRGDPDAWLSRVWCDGPSPVVPPTKVAYVRGDYCLRTENGYIKDLGSPIGVTVAWSSPPPYTIRLRDGKKENGKYRVLRKKVVGREPPLYSVMLFGASPKKAKRKGKGKQKPIYEKQVYYYKCLRSKYPRCRVQTLHNWVRRKIIIVQVYRWPIYRLGEKRQKTKLAQRIGAERNFWSDMELRTSTRSQMNGDKHTEKTFILFVNKMTILWKRNKWYKRRLESRAMAWIFTDTGNKAAWAAERLELWKRGGCKKDDYAVRHVKRFEKASVVTCQSKDDVELLNHIAYGSFEERPKRPPLNRILKKQEAEKLEVGTSAFLEKLGSRTLKKLATFQV